MSFINYMAREINCKLVYYGPGLCGKTTNLQYIYERTNPEAKGKMNQPRNGNERTLFLRLSAVVGSVKSAAQNALPPLHCAGSGFSMRAAS